MASSSSTPFPNGSLKIAIIGFGPFAQCLAKTFLKQGHILAATSRSDYSLLCSQLGITFYRDMDELMEPGSQVILLCTSIISLGDVIRSIPIDRLRMPLLFVDVLSVKEYPRDLLLRGCRMVEMSCQEHDEMAARSQFLAHTFGRILAEMGIQSTPMDTKGFQTLLQLLEKLDLAFKAVREKLLERTKDVELND